MASTVVGLFDLRDDAQTAVQNLINAGYDRKDISVVAADTSGEFTSSTPDSEGSLAGEGAVSGATSGAVVGGLFGLLVGAGALAFPAVGLVAIGPLAGLLTGAGIGAVSGGIIGALIGLGIPEEHAGVYAEGVRRGGTLVSVYVAEGGDTGRVEDILDDAGAVDVNERHTTYRESGFNGYDDKAPFYSREEAELERNRYRTTAAATGAGAAGSYAYADGTTPDASNAGSSAFDNAANASYGTNETGYGTTGTGYSVEGNPSLTGNEVPGIQTGGTNADGSPDTRGITEKIADGVTGDKIDDKTGKRV